MMKILSEKERNEITEEVLNGLDKIGQESNQIGRFDMDAQINQIKKINRLISGIAERYYQKGYNDCLDVNEEIKRS